MSDAAKAYLVPKIPTICLAVLWSYLGWQWWQIGIGLSAVAFAVVLLGDLLKSANARGAKE